MMRLRNLFLCLLLGSFSIVGHAQNIVKGTVKDSDGNELIGVSIRVEGTTDGAITNVDGTYSISVGDDATLVFSYIGFNTQTVAVNNRSVINVVMTENTDLLEEVVVIGYGNQRAESVSGSVSQISTDGLADIPQVSVDQLLQGRAAGVNVTQNSGQPGSAVSIRIRGVGSINGTSEPLYVIDGVPVSGDSRNIATTGNSTASTIGAEAGSADVSPLAAINPNDIESITVLKDASATAIYGSRGANGVVIITTRGGRRGEAKLSYNAFYGVQRPTNMIDMMNLREYAVFDQRVREIYGLDRIPEFTRPELLPEGTNWQQELFRDALMQNHNLSISGGGEGHDYFISGSFTDQEGIVLGSDFQRGTIRANINADINEKIKAGFSFTAGRTSENIVLTNAANSVVTLALLMPPSVAVRNPDGSWAGPVTDEEIAFGLRNPIAEVSQIDNNLLRNNVLGNFFIDYEIIPGLTFRAEAGGNFGFNETDQFIPSFEYGAISRGVNTATKTRESTSFLIFKQLLTYNKTWGNHLVTLLAGHESQESRWNGIRGQDTDFIGNDFPILGSGSGTDVLPLEYQGSTAIESYFARAIYSYKGKYDLTTSLRRDASSMFTGSNRVGYFPAISASWNISEESFMKNFNMVQNLRIYGGYGEVGNQEINPFSFGSRLNSISNDLGTGFQFANFSNPNLRWETSRQTNLGLSFFLFDSKLNTTVEVYKKVSSDFLFQTAPNDAVTGGNAPGAVAPPWLNIGEMQNTGIDVSIGYDQDFQNGIQWSSQLTVSHYRNRINELLGDRSINGSVTLAGDVQQNITFAREGQPVGMFQGYVVEGLFRSIEDIEGAPVQFGRPFQDALFSTTWLGDIQYADINGDGVINGEDITTIGNPHPDFTFGFQNSFSYKSFSLSLFLQGSYGNDIFNAVDRAITAANLSWRNQSPRVLDHWSIQNPNSSEPRLARNDTQNINVSDRYVEDGSYLRVQNITFGYTLPTDWARKARMQRVRVYTSIQNLYTLTNYSGYDPEVGSINQNVLLSGIDNGRYPLPRTFTLGINLEF